MDEDRDEDISLMIITYMCVYVCIHKDPFDNHHQYQKRNDFIDLHTTKYFVS